MRRATVHLIGELVPTRRFLDLDWLSRDDTAGVKTRLKAAVDIIDRGGPVTALYDFAVNPKMDRGHRLRAARKVGKVDRGLGGRLLVFIAQSYRPTNPDQVTLLCEATHSPPSPLPKRSRTSRRTSKDRGRFASMSSKVVSSTSTSPSSSTSSSRPPLRTKIVKTRRAGEIRIRATCLLPVD